MDFTIFFGYTYYITIPFCVPHFYDLSILVGCWSSAFLRRVFFFTKFKICVFFNYKAFTASVKGGYPLYLV